MQKKFNKLHQNAEKVQQITSKCRKLTQKQQRFATEYLIDLNTTQAAIRAGYSERTAYSIGNENLKKPEIQKYINVNFC